MQFQKILSLLNLDVFFRMMVQRVFLLILVLSPFAIALEPCESIAKFSWWGNSHKTCHMNDSNTVTTSEFSISSAKDAAIELLNLNGNRKIAYLPKNADEKFPGLLIYDAGSCSIKSISKQNFKNMKKLKRLFLGFNQIERILSDTFDDATALLEVALGKYFAVFLHFYKPENRFV